VKFIKALIILVLVPLLFASCELRSIPALIKGDKVRVKGVTLEHSRIITLTDNENMTHSQLKPVREISHLKADNPIHLK